jgi:hypothetical protein
MKLPITALLASTVLFGCQPKATDKVLVPRTLTAAEDFNQFPKEKTNVLSIFQQTDNTIKKRADRVPSLPFHVKFADTLLSIQMNAADPKSVVEKFSFAEFLNTQKSSMLVQPADSSGLVAPFYIITVNNNKIEAVNLYRAAGGANDSQYAKGVTPIGRSGYVINNDYFIASVSAKIYPIKRQKENERIHGTYFMNSPDRKTLVFLTANSLYQVYYPDGQVYTLTLPAAAPQEGSALMSWIQDKYSWQRVSGVTFLKKNVDFDRIIDIDEFKK